MAFQPKHKLPGSLDKAAGSTPNSASTIDQITDAVREKLIAPGVPLEAKPKSAAGHTYDWRSVLGISGADRISQVADAPYQAQGHVQGEDTALARQIDHTLLKPDATLEEIRRVCKEARDHDFATVCVNSSFVGAAAELLKGSSVKAIAVVGFPLGAATTAAKSFEAAEAVKSGAREIDMVINIGALKGKDYALVLEDIRQVVEASAPYPVKVILETSNLTLEEKIIGSALSKAAGAAFVKTSTGFGSGGATVEDIELMRRIVGPEMGVKASGGIRTHDDAAKMIAAGANRIGASASVSIVQNKAPAATSKGADAGAPKKPKNSLY